MIGNEDYDFCGYATRNDLKCADGRVIRKDAFKECDGKTVPLVWMHEHKDVNQVLGHALLENREDGVYTYGKFNDTESGLKGKKLLHSKDITDLSIYATRLVQNGNDVIHGAIREVSLVLAGANPGAYIEECFAHSEGGEEDDGIFLSGEENCGLTEISHAEDPKPQKEEPKKEDNKEEDPKMDNENKELDLGTEFQKVMDKLTADEQDTVYAVVAEALNNKEDTMKHNVFEGENNENTLAHSEEEMKAVFDDVKRYGSLKESALAHGIENIDVLFPEVQTVTPTPELVKREDSWVAKVMNGTHHSPFSRVKSTYANLTADEARAKGYVKGNMKVEEVITAAKRTTTPTTIYKKQKLDRDDVLDITDFDVAAWIKSEMRGMLDEEIARAILVGDQRSASSDDKINEQNIRPIYTDSDVYTVKHTTAYTSSDSVDAKAKKFIRACVKARKDYKGSGNPVMFTTEDLLTDCLLMEDSTGRVIYDTLDKLKNALRVSDIITVPVMEGLTRTDAQSATQYLDAIIVNLADYNVGADKGGNVGMFEDFDIDYNAEKYLIETRCSGALVKPYSALVIEHTQA